ncbi:MAG: DegT/DnrJ/EryC1/StrS family aminotransferase [Pseudobacteriovorax sp.]|nr:DegT/DnrJ/EryC1/StrS family aminotransferase [Pseudobacteriovorax sp.]
MKIPITKTYFDQDDLDIIRQPLENGWVVQGPFVKKFEDGFAEYTGSLKAAACTSCTTGLHLATAAIGLKPGDEAIVPGFTWISTANVVEYQGATVRFCDVDLDTFNLDIDHLESLVNEKTKAVLPVHLFGLSADMDPILSLARTHNLAVIEDAACGFGSFYKSKHVGTLGDYGAFSLHPRKAITTGEGGMLLTQNEDNYKLVTSMRDHGASKTDFDRHTSRAAFLLPSFPHLGFNYRMTDIQGALGVTQLKKAGYILENRRKRAQIYFDELSDIPGLRLPFRHDDYTHSYQSFVCLFSPEEPTLANVEEFNRRRNQIMGKLEDQGISTRQGTHAVVNLDFYKNKYSLSPEMFPKSFFAEKLSLSLPLYPQMTDIEQEFVIGQLKKELLKG